MMILAYLLRSSVDWRGADVVLKMAVATEAAAAGVRENVAALIERSRTGVDFEVLVSGGRPFDEILKGSSRDADLVLTGIAEPGEDFTGYYETLQRRAEGLPTTVFVLAAEDLAFGEVLVERAAPE